MSSRFSIQSIFYYLACCNFIDGFITYWGVSNHVIEEANPLMNLLVTLHPIAFLGFKVTLSVVLVFLGMMRWACDSGMVRGLSIVAAALYTAILAYHAYWLFLLER